MFDTANLWQAIGILAAGLGLFLYGISILADALRQTADAALRRALAAGTRSPFRGLILGTFLTGLLQSSSASTVLMVGFCNAGLLSLRQSVGLILGAGIGATLTLQLLTVTWLSYAAPWAVCAGALLMLLTQRRAARLTGLALLGFGLIFVGFALMKAGVTPWEPSISRWFEALARPGMPYLLASLGVGVAATIIVQSAAVTTGIAIALAAAGAIRDMPSALALMIGCNIGTTITTVLASAGGTNVARQVAATHVIFRTLGGLLSLLALPLYVRLFSGGSPLGSDMANFHTLHNTVNALVFLPLSGALAWLAVRLTPRREDNSPAPLHLDFSRGVDHAARTRQAYAETIRLVDLTRAMTSDALAGMAARRDSFFEKVLAREQQVDGLHGTIVQFLMMADNDPVPGGSLDTGRLLQLAHNIERIGDHAENLVELARFYQPPKQPMNALLLEDLQQAGRMVDGLFAIAEPAFARPDAASIGKITSQTEAFHAFVTERTARAHSLAKDGQCRPMDAVLFEDFMENLRSSASHLLRAAKAMANGGM